MTWTSGCLIKTSPLLPSPLPLPPNLIIIARLSLLTSEISGPGQPQEPRSFWSCVFSRRYGWHLVWLSVIQLWHYLFIGTFNSLLTILARGDQALGMW